MPERSTNTLPPPLSLWVETAQGPDRRGRPLPDRADVVVVGAGIVGLTAAEPTAQPRPLSGGPRRSGSPAESPGTPPRRSPHSTR